MELTMLGTGHATVTECYNTCFVLSEGEKRFLVDGGGGNGLLRQLKRAGIAWQDLQDVFVTHRHLDHVGGILWLLRMFCQHMSRGGGPAEVRIYAHAQLATLLGDMAEGLLGPGATRVIGDRLLLIPVEDGKSRQIIGHHVTFFDIGSVKDRQFGFQMELEAGRKLVCCGDEPFHPCERNYAEGADWLLHEAFCLWSERDIYRPYEKAHSTAKDACLLAEELGVKNLLLYHTEDDHLDRRRELYTREGGAFFTGNLLVPEDLETITL